MDNKLTVPNWITVKWKTFSPIEAPLEGAWRLTGIWEYDNERECWLVPSHNLWGPKDYLFEQHTVTIHTPYEVKSVQYEYYPEKRYLLFDDDSYFISELTETKLVIHPINKYGPHKFTLTRIDPAQIHEKTDNPQPELSDLKGIWWIDAEYEFVEGTWQLKTDCRTVPGMNFWKITYWPHWDEYEFGRSPRKYGDIYKSLNEKHFIFKRLLGSQKSQFFHPEKDTQGCWAYLLDSMTGDFRDSRQKLHLTPIDPNTSDLFVMSLLWAESERHMTTAADKMPLELLRLWCIPNPEKMASLIAENKFIECPEEFRSEEYAGVYVFIHYAFVSAKKYDLAQIADNYLKFQEILRLWLELYDAGKIVKHIYPFLISKYPEQFSALQEANELQESKHITLRLMTCEMLKQRLEAIRTNEHYLYALMKGMQKEVFYLQIYTQNEDRDNDPKKCSLHEFLSEYETLHPDDPVSMNFCVCRDDVDRDAQEYVIYANSMNRISDLAAENLETMFDEFLACYCEKWLRNNKPFGLTPETICHFGFTDEDVQVLGPKIERINRELMNRIRAEFRKFAELDFIRQEIA